MAQRTTIHSARPKRSRPAAHRKAASGSPVETIATALPDPRRMLSQDALRAVAIVQHESTD